MGVQGVGLVSQVGEGIINLHVLQLETNTQSWLVNPDLLQVGLITIFQSLLKIIYA